MEPEPAPLCRVGSTVAIHPPTLAFTPSTHALIHAPVLPHSFKRARSTRVDDPGGGGDAHSHSEALVSLPYARGK